jgi:hypothetical protein
MGEYPLAWAACLGNETVYNLLLDEVSGEQVSPTCPVNSIQFIM